MFRPLLAALLSAAALLPLQSPLAATDFAFQQAIPQLAPAQMPLLDVVDTGERLIAAGERGLILISDDKGASWRQGEVPVSATLTALSFADANNGWAVGHAGTILHTSDGGESWELQFDGNEANRQYLAHVQAVAAAMGEEFAQLQASGAEQVELDDFQYALEDAEFNVEDAQEALEKGPVDPFLNVLMLDASRGFAMGAYGMLYRTEDGGDNWQLGIGGIDNPDRYHYYAMAADTAGNLVLSGEAGLLYVSRDGGDNWRRVEGLYDGSLFGVLTQGDAVITFGLRGNIFRSTDQGETWAPVDSGESYSLYGGEVLDNGKILLVGAAGQVLSSTDAGQSYTAWNHPARQTLSSAAAVDGAGYYLIGMGGIEAVKQLGAEND